MPDVSPLINALGWSFAIGFGCWVAMQLIKAWETFPREAPADEPTLEAPPASHDARH